MHFVLPGKDVDRRAAGEKVLDHLPGHVLRIGRDAGLGRAVIAGKNQHVRLRERGSALLDEADFLATFSS
jgi:hypothetical protein